MQKQYQQLENKVRESFNNEGTGHDWFHIERVINNALFIQKSEGGDKDIIRYAALLHDIDDHKFNGGDFNKGAETARKLIEDHPLDHASKEKIVEIVRNVSYKGSAEKDSMSTLEGKIVQDADRLDAIGAIGIARTFAYGGSIGQPIYTPDIPPAKLQDRESYVNNRTHTINHFYEKLLLLKDRMHTSTGKRIAEERTNYMKSFLKAFYQEWEGLK